MRTLEKCDMQLATGRALIIACTKKARAAENALAVVVIFCLIQRMIASMCCTGLRHFLRARRCPKSVRTCMNRTLLHGSL